MFGYFFGAQKSNQKRVPFLQALGKLGTNLKDFPAQASTNHVKY
jgi:hypothetical protein